MSGRSFNRVMRRPGVLSLGCGLILFSIFWVSISVFGETYDNLVLSRLGAAEMLRYLETTDHNKGFSEDQIAAKYIIGEFRPDIPVPARVVLQWKSLPPSEQRQLKVIWFREHYRQLNIEDVGKSVNLDYLKMRATSEYRENPLELAPKDQAEEKGKKDKKEKHKPDAHRKGIKRLFMKPASTDTAALNIRRPKGQKKGDTELAPPKKSKSPVPMIQPSSKTGNKKSDTTPPQIPAEGGLKKMPWLGGIPTKMKNE